MRQALDERRQLIEQRANAVLDAAIGESAQWVNELEPPPAGQQRNEWHRLAMTIAAYRDRHGVRTPSALGAQASSTAQRIDRMRAEAMLGVIKTLGQGPPHPVQARRQETRVLRR